MTWSPNLSQLSTKYYYMGNQIITQPQTFKNASTVMGAAAGLSAVSGLTVYGDISASGTIYGAGTVPVATTYTFNGSVSAFAINGFTNTTATNYWVYLDGVHQVAGTDYSLSATSGGGNIIMTTVPPSGVVASVISLQSPVVANTTPRITPYVSTFTGTGSQTDFVIGLAGGYTDNTASKYMVSVGGLIQVPTTNYGVTSTSGGTISFTSAPPLSANIVVYAF